MTRGHKSSEYKACLLAYLGSLALCLIGLYKAEAVDLSELAILIGAHSTPLMWYAGMRTTKKFKHGEDGE